MKLKLIATGILLTAAALSGCAGTTERVQVETSATLVEGDRIDRQASDLYREKFYMNLSPEEQDMMCHMFESYPETAWGTWKEAQSETTLPEIDRVTFEYMFTGICK